MWDAMVWTAVKVDQSGSQHLRLRSDDNRRFLVAAMHPTTPYQKIAVRKSDGRMRAIHPFYELIDNIPTRSQIVTAHAPHFMEYGLEYVRAGQIFCRRRGDWHTGHDQKKAP